MRSMSESNAAVVEGWQGAYMSWNLVSATANDALEKAHGNAIKIAASAAVFVDAPDARAAVALTGGFEFCNVAAAATTAAGVLTVTLVDSSSTCRLAAGTTGAVALTGHLAPAAVDGTPETYTYEVQVSSAIPPFPIETMWDANDGAWGTPRCWGTRWYGTPRLLVRHRRRVQRLDSLSC